MDATIPSRRRIPRLPRQPARRAVTLVGLAACAWGLVACWPARGAPIVDRALCGVARQPLAAPDTLLLFIETAAGAAPPVRFDARRGEMRSVESSAASPPAPTPVGALPCTRGSDGGPLRALVVDAPELSSGAMLRVQPIGVIHLSASGKLSERIIVVPADRPYREVPADVRAVIEGYLKASAGDAAALEVRGWGGVSAAKSALALAMAAAAAL